MDETIGEQIDQLRIATQADVQRMWELIIRPLGFWRRSLWVVWVDADRRLVKQVVEIVEHEDVPTERDLDGLYAMLEEVHDDFAPGGSVAFLLSRPGDGLPQRDDVQWARALLDGARRHRFPVQPLHIATDSRILPITPDDLAA